MAAQSPAKKLKTQKYCDSFSYVIFKSKDHKKDYVTGLSGNVLIEECSTKLHWMTNGDYSVLEICNDCGKISNWDSIKAKQDVLKIKNEDRSRYETESEGTTEEEEEEV